MSDFSYQESLKVIFQLRWSDIIARGNSVIEPYRFQFYFIRLQNSRSEYNLDFSANITAKQYNSPKANKTVVMLYKSITTYPRV